MSTEAPEAPQAPEAPRRGTLTSGKGRLADPIFKWVVAACGTIVLVILALMVIRTTTEAWPVFAKEGFFGFLIGEEWTAGGSRTEITGTYGAWPFIYGTLITSVIAIAIALPLSIMVAVYLTHLAPRRIAKPLSYTVELLAAVPSVIFGLWGLHWFLPNVMRPFFEWLEGAMGWFFLFEGPVRGVGYLPAGIVLAIMILPIMTAIIREVVAVQPLEQQMAAYALGSTRWEVITKVVLPASFSGIVAAAMLGLGRALGETIAVLMLIGGSQGWGASLFGTGSSMASHIAATFGESSPETRTGLMAIGVALFLVTMIVNILARVIVWRLGQFTGDAAV
ncbi:MULTISPECIES: phosphate ABC transporter permease subunit PstC [Nocardiopsidaceae]|jgi:phosphate transport system permease protein|uniref:Phosphate transport system permease protein n=2 Tax=Nocardiopsidaceae TaxID=83676 RepID=A0ABY6YNF3_9ACTN|nr:phosphate ABC transporter permease subunit PstC [Streptomonospora nanhaiensis]WAE73794.1 phosphate ABC transporter permease subunit PstC [Streptomonospora nanhaiensis]